MKLIATITLTDQEAIDLMRGDDPEGPPFTTVACQVQYQLTEQALAGHLGMTLRETAQKVNDREILPSTIRFITILDVARARGVKQEADGAITADELLKVGFPIIGGCMNCHATIGTYNAYPSRAGYWKCEDCIGNDGFVTAEEFEEHQRVIAWADDPR